MNIIHLGQDLANHYAKFGHDWVTIGNNVTIWGVVTLIAKLDEEGQKLPIIIGDDCILQHGAIIYGGNILRDKVRICHHTTIRENMFIGKHTTIGSGVVCEGHSVIGDHVIVNAQSHITAFMKIYPYAFLGAHVSPTNDSFFQYRTTTHGHNLRGPIIGSRAHIGSNVTILPGLGIGAYSMVGAGSIVTRNIPSREVWWGTPAKWKRDRTHDMKEKDVWCDCHFAGDRLQDYLLDGDLHTDGEGNIAFTVPMMEFLEGKYNEQL